ncbi:protein virilizer homolog [Saccoglossus kowalevskii]
MAEPGDEDVTEIHLLFCETFDHEKGEELNLDLVQFPRPVCISEIRIIPSGTRAHTEFYEENKLGRTSPANFKLELFINNLSKPGSSIFERLGILEYEESNHIQLVTKSEIPTDGVILRGLYSSITVAIYGVLTTVAKSADDIPPSPPPPPPPPQTVGKRKIAVVEAKAFDMSERENIYQERREFESERAKRPKYEDRVNVEQKIEELDRPRDPKRLIRPPSPPRPPPNESHGPKSPPIPPLRERRGPRTPPGDPKTDSSPESIHLPSDDDVHEPGEIPDEEEIIERSDLFEPLTPEHSPEPSNIIEEYDTWIYDVPSFNPFQCEFLAPVTFSTPELTQYDIEKLKTTDSMPPESNKIIEIINTFQSEEHSSKWVSALEELPGLVNPCLAYVNSDSIKVLAEWTLEALDLDNAIAQSIAVNVKQLKAGMNLTTALCNCGPTVAEVLVEKNVQGILFDLLFADHMSSSLKLTALQALDSATNCEMGLVKFVSSHQSKVELTCYQRALKLMLSNQTVRVVTALTALLRKVHIFEVLGVLYMTVDRIMESTPLPPESTKETQSKDTESIEHIPQTHDESPQKMTFMDTLDKSSPNTQQRSDNQSISMETDTSIISSGTIYIASSNDIETIMECIEEITYSMENAPHTIVQPPIKAFPTSAKITGPPCTADPYPVLFHMFNTRKLLESLLLLVSCPATAGNLDIMDAVRTLLLVCLKTKKGLLFLAHNIDICKVLVQILTNNDDDESLEDNETQQLGLTMIYQLQTLQNIDQIRDFLRKGSLQTERDNVDIISILHTMYSMTFTPIGKTNVAHVLNLDDHLESILSFLELTGDEETDYKIKKPASYGYALGLLLLAMQYCDNTNTIINYATKLSSICPENTELSKWISPIQGLKFDITSIEPLVEYLKNHTSEISSNLANEGTAMVTALRILKHISCPNHQSEDSEVHQKDLQYNLATIQLFSANAMEVFILVLKKLGDFTLRPWQQGFPLPSSVNHIIECMITPLLILIKRMLSELLNTGLTQFKDMRLICALLTVHTVVCSPTSNILSTDHSTIQLLIVDILLTFTKPVLQSDTENGKCLKFVKMVYQTTGQPLTDEEIQQALVTRKLWSLHLHSLAPQIYAIIKDISGTGYHPLQHILRRVCWQLADLAAPTALLVVRYTFEILEEELNKSSSKEDDKVVDVFSPHSNKLLMLIMYMVSQASVKAPLLHYLRSTVKADEKFSEVLVRLLNLLNVTSESSTHLHGQEYIVGIVQSICDPEITMMMATESTLPTVEQLANGLPSKDHLELILTALLEHISDGNQSYATILLCLRTFVMLTEHDYGFYHLKCAFEKNSNAFYSLFKKLSTSFNKDSADCLSTLSTFLDLLQLLISADSLEDDQTTPEPSANLRTYTVNVVKLSELLKWNTESRDHPIKVIEKLLVECCKDDEAMDSLLDGVTTLAQTLNSVTDDTVVKPDELTEPVLPAPDTLSVQFNTRAFYILGDMEDERINFWLTVPPLDDPDMEIDMVKADLLELSEKCCPDFDLKDEIAKGLAGEDGTTPRKKIRVGKRRFDPLIARRDTRFQGQNKRGHKAMPGHMRGGYRPFYGGHGRPNDLFRQRAQNTSRPPSMHVDDFEAIDYSQSPHPPPPKKIHKGPPARNLGRGGFIGGPGYQRGGFIGGPGGRWAGGPSGGYNRRDLGPGMGNIQGRGPNIWGNRQPQQPPPPSPGGYQGRTSRGFLSRRPDNRPSGPGYGRPPPLPPTRADGLYGSPTRGNPRGGMRGSSSRGGPSPTRSKPMRGFRGMPGGGRWVGPGGKTDPHTRFLPPSKPSRGGYGRHDGGGSRHGGRPFSR